MVLVERQKQPMEDNIEFRKSHTQMWSMNFWQRSQKNNEEKNCLFDKQARITGYSDTKKLT